MNNRCRPLWKPRIHNQLLRTDEEQGPAAASVHPDLGRSGEASAAAAVLADWEAGTGKAGHVGMLAEVHPNRQGLVEDHRRGSPAEALMHLCPQAAVRACLVGAALHVQLARERVQIPLFADLEAVLCRDPAAIRGQDARLVHPAAAESLRWWEVEGSSRLL